MSWNISAMNMIYKNTAFQAGCQSGGNVAVHDTVVVIFHEILVVQ